MVMFAHDSDLELPCAFSPHGLAHSIPSIGEFPFIGIGGPLRFFYHCSQTDHQMRDVKKKNCGEARGKERRKKGQNQEEKSLGQNIRKKTGKYSKKEKKCNWED